MWRVRSHIFLKHVDIHFPKTNLLKLPFLHWMIVVSLLKTGWPWIQRWLSSLCSILSVHLAAFMTVLPCFGTVALHNACECFVDSRLFVSCIFFSLCLCETSSRFCYQLHYFGWFIRVIHSPSKLPLTVLSILFFMNIGFLLAS